MGFFDKIKMNSTCNKALRLHQVGSTLNDQHRYAEARQKFDAAREMYQKAYDMGCRTPAMLIAMGLIHMREGRFEQAREVFLEAEKQKGIRPEERARLRNNYAILQWKTGRLDEAIAQMRIIEQSGRTSFVYGTLGYFLIEKATQTGDFTEAEAFNLEGLDYDDEDSVVLDNLGQLYLRMGDREKARSFFEKAHAQKPSQIDTLYYLAKFAVEDGDTQKAREYLDTALEAIFSSACTVSREDAQKLRDSLNG